MAIGNSIDEVQEFNFLDITIDQNITWTPHIRNISIKIFESYIGVLRKLKRIFPQHILRLIYISLNPHLRFEPLGIQTQTHYMYYITENSHRNSKMKSIGLPLIFTQNLTLVETIKFDLKKLSLSYRIQS